MSIIDHALDELESYGAFEPGWDGYEGEPISENTIQIAKNYLYGLGFFNNDFSSRNIIEVDVCPLPHGAIDIYIHYKNGVESTISIECSNNATPS